MNEDEWIVLADYDQAAQRAEGPRLEEWIERYPQHRRALVEFALNSYVLERGVEYQTDTEAIARRYLSGAAAVRARMAQAKSSPLGSLLAAAKESGLSPGALAARLGIGPTLLAKLERRLIAAATVPRGLLTELAAAVERSADDVALYLRAPATLSPQASYRAASAPSLRVKAESAGMVAESRGPTGESFVDAVRASRDMTDEQKARWVAASESPGTDS